VDLASATKSLNGVTPVSISNSDAEWIWLTWTTGTPSGTTLPINWTFNSGSEAFNGLGPNDTLTLVYNVEVSDGALTASSPVTIVINGTNDAPVISLSGGDTASSSITEGDVSGLSRTGTLSVSDAESADSLTASVAGVAVHSSSMAASAAIPPNASLLAMMGVGPTTSGGVVRGTNALTWTFNPGSQTFDYKHSNLSAWFIASSMLGWYHFVHDAQYHPIFPFATSFYRHSIRHVNRCANRSFKSKSTRLELPLNQRVQGSSPWRCIVYF
jgi:VCBS repeat-containing protein